MRAPSACLYLSVSVAVLPKTGEILDFAVARMPASGNLAAIGVVQLSHERLLPYDGRPKQRCRFPPECHTSPLP